MFMLQGTQGPQGSPGNDGRNGTDGMNGAIVSAVHNRVFLTASLLLYAH